MFARQPEDGLNMTIRVFPYTDGDIQFNGMARRFKKEFTESITIGVCATMHAFSKVSGVRATLWWYGRSYLPIIGEIPLYWAANIPSGVLHKVVASDFVFLARDDKFSRFYDLVGRSNILGPMINDAGVEGYAVSIRSHLEED
jgi:hypothetical protein